jgi:hypothetical protein
VLCVLSMERRRRMVGSVHPDDDPVEHRETRHPAIVRHPRADGHQPNCTPTQTDSKDSADSLSPTT